MLAFLQNLRLAEETLGDIRTQFAAYADCSRMLNELLDEGLDTLTAVADEIVVRSEASMAPQSARYQRALHRRVCHRRRGPLRVECAVTVDDEKLSMILLVRRRRLGH